MRYGWLVTVLAVGWCSVVRAQLSAAERIASEVPDVSDLPLFEYGNPATGNDCLVILLSGDGGWRPLVQGVSNQLAAKGYNVLGINSFRYVRRYHSPERITADVSRLIRYGQAVYGTKRVWLVGYSCGANFVPFVYNRLAPDLKKEVERVALLSPESKADFRFHWYNRVNLNSPRARPVHPELAQMHTQPTVFLYGAKEDYSWCADLLNGAFRVLVLPGGHHYDFNTERVTATILKSEY